MVYVNLTIISDSNFQSDDTIFNFYEDDEIT